MKPLQILELEKFWGIEIGIGRYETDNEGQVTHLDLSHNQITNVSPLSALTNLKILDLWDNRITDIAVLQELTNLQSLVLFSNQITDITPLRALINLQSLELSSNQITDVTALNALTNLHTLDLRANQITDISALRGLLKDEMTFMYSGNFSTREVVSLYGNPLPPALIEAIDLGSEAVLVYLYDLEKEKAKGTLPLNEAKMILIGEPDAGKTSLLNYLTGKPFADTKTTQGIRIEQWEIKDQASTSFRINCWDFGGQEMQSTVHRFFLTQDTLYVVVLNARKEEKPDKYLEQVRSYAPDSPVLIVINRMDEHQGSVDEARLMAEYRTKSGAPMIRGIFKTSVRKVHAENDPHFLPAVQALEADIVRQLLQLPNIRQEVPRNYLEVKGYLESRFFRDEPYITHERYEAVCRDKNLELASDDDLLSVLDRLGTVRHFDDKHTRNLHILNPEWLTDGVYRILTSEHTHGLRGVISEKDFSRILYKTETHNFAYPKQHYGYLIEMIRRFYLGYVDPDTHAIFIPQAFLTDYPAGFRPDDFKKDALHFFFQYETFIPAGAMSSFIARTFGRVSGDLYWQNGIVIAQTEAEELQTALVMQTDTKKRIDVWVQGVHRREFFIEIRKIFREFHAKYQGLKVAEMIGLDARRETSVMYRVLIAHKHKHKTDYTDEEGNDYKIDALLGTFESPAATQRSIVQNFHGDYNDMRGAKQIQFMWMRVEAQTIEEELAKFCELASQKNQEILNQLIADLQALQKAESPKKAKGVVEQLVETAKNLPKIASEEAVKWATKVGLDGVPFTDRFENLQKRLSDFFRNANFQDFTGLDNLG